MPLFPNRTKYRKQQKGKLTGQSKAGFMVRFGDYGIQALERGRVTSKQLEASRIAINRSFSRRGKVWITVFPDKPVSKKPAEVRMGKGKGSVSEWVACVRPGRLLFEVGEVSEEEAKRALRKAAAKLPIKTRFVKRLEQP